MAALQQSQDYLRAAAIVSGHAVLPVAAIIVRRGRIARRARQIALYLTVVGCNHANKATARISGITPKAIRQALHAVEDRRDDPAFDAELSALEEMMACAN